MSRVVVLTTKSILGGVWITTTEYTHMPGSRIGRVAVASNRTRLIHLYLTTSMTQALKHGGWVLGVTGSSTVGNAKQ